MCLMLYARRLCIFRKEAGLERFVPMSLADSMKRKELRKLLSHFLKQNALISHESKESEERGGSAKKAPPTQMTALQAKLHYLSIITELPSYGAKCFSTNVNVSLENLHFISALSENWHLFHFQDSNAETVILISPKFGISQISSLRNSVVSLKKTHIFINFP